MASIIEEIPEKIKEIYKEATEPLGKKPCTGIRNDLKLCLLASDCVRIHKKTPRECLLVNDGTIPNECMALRQTFFECKRSLIIASGLEEGKEKFDKPPANCISSTA